MHRITEKQIEEMRASGYDRSTIIDAETWLTHCATADTIISQIDAAFDGVTLEDGIGLRESDGIDGYAGTNERRRLREADEKEDWRRIPVELLSYCNAAPSFLNGKGLRFHAPAFMVAELRGQYDQGFIDRMIFGSYSAQDLIGLLTPQQRAAVIACIRFYGDIGQYDPSDITAAIARFNEQKR